MLKQPDTCAQQDRCQIDMDFVEQPGLEALLRDLRASYDNVFAARGCLCQLDSPLDAFGDKCERQIFPGPLRRDRWVTIKTGTFSGCLPPQAREASKSPRPVTCDPAASRFSEKARRWRARS